MSTDVNEINDLSFFLEKAMEDGGDMLSYGYSLINMKEIERRLEKQDFSLLSIFSEKEYDYYQNLRIKKNQVQWIAGRYAIKEALYKYKRVEPTTIDVLKAADASPYLVQYPNLQVTISHSHPFCVGMVSKKVMGVDIEKIFNPKEALLSRFYHKEEVAILRTFSSQQEYNTQATLYWTRKEAISKVLKLGMALDFKLLDTTKDTLIMNQKKIKVSSFFYGKFCISIGWNIIEDIYKY